MCLNNFLLFAVLNFDPFVISPWPSFYHPFTQSRQLSYIYTETEHKAKVYNDLEDHVASITEEIMYDKTGHLTFLYLNSNVQRVRLKQIRQKCHHEVRTTIKKNSSLSTCIWNGSIVHKTAIFIAYFKVHCGMKYMTVSKWRCNFQ